MNIDLTAPNLHDDNQAREWFEQSRWPSGRRLENLQMLPLQAATIVPYLCGW